ncbi:MAG TPA: glycine betaine ABC transporter substrate-binding protein [Xanthobacteraceae bacterium]|nr:glycine betaine ABC transporter substrate-binding protein [Xanthobacteraceae bacterium]
MSEFGERFSEALARLPDYLGQHVIVSVTALALGLAISLPLAVVATRHARLRWPLLAFASIIQTIPGLALLALFYPLLLGISALTEAAFGTGFSALGFLPSVLALTLYSMLPVLRNTITGIEGIDPAVKAASLGVGMTPRQSLFIVELPLALPVIMAGIRTAAVWVIGTATLSTPVGQTSLGNYIFAGLQTQNWVSVLFGCVAAALLAIVVDQLLALMESGIALRRRVRTAVGALGILLVLAAALVPGWSRPTAAYVVGAKTFTEQYILASLMQQRLQANGLSAARRDGLGSTVIFNALASGDIDVYVDYSGTIWANHMRRTDAQPREVVLEEMGAWLKKERGIALLGPLGFENAYALAMRRDRAEQLGIRTIADLVRHAPQLAIGGDYEFFDRPEWAALRDAYGLNFRRQRQMDSTFMYSAVANGEVDVISAFSSDGRIARFDLVTLTDPKQALPPYDAVLLLAPRRADDKALRDALMPLVGKIDVELMRETNLRADRDEDKETPAQAARWLWKQIGAQ